MDKNNYIKQLEETISKFSKPLKDIPFPIAIKAISGEDKELMKGGKMCDITFHWASKVVLEKFLKKDGKVDWVTLHIFEKKEGIEEETSCIDLFPGEGVKGEEILPVEEEDGEPTV